VHTIVIQKSKAVQVVREKKAVSYLYDSCDKLFIHGSYDSPRCQIGKRF